MREHKPDIVGLSGLLVKSAQQMVITAEDLASAGDRCADPGGRRRALAQLRGPTNRPGLRRHRGLRQGRNERPRARQADRRAAALRGAQGPALRNSAPSCPSRWCERPSWPPSVRRARAPCRWWADPPRRRTFRRHVITNTPLPHIWRFINPLMLYGRHLGFKGSLARTLETAELAELRATEDGRKALEVAAVVDEVKAECEAGLMQARAVYQFFRAASDGNRLVLFDEDGNEACHFEFPRQRRDERLVPRRLGEPARRARRLDLHVRRHRGGGHPRARRRAQAPGDYLKSHVLQALALETAEGYAELLHAQIRSLWGFPDGLQTTMLERFRAELPRQALLVRVPSLPATRGPGRSSSACCGPRKSACSSPTAA